MHATSTAAEPSIGDRLNGNIRAEMARKNITNLRMAEQLGFSTQAFWRRMSGAVDWNVGELAQVATVLGVEPRDLIAP